MFLFVSFITVAAVIQLVWLFLSFLIHVCRLKIENKRQTQHSSTEQKHFRNVQCSKSKQRTRDEKKAATLLLFCCLCIFKQRTDRLNVCSFISFRCVMRAHISRFSIAFHFILVGIFFFLSTLNWCQHLSAALVFFLFVVASSYVHAHRRNEWSGRVCAWVRPVQQVLNRDSVMWNGLQSERNGAILNGVAPTQADALKMAVPNTSSRTKLSHTLGSAARTPKPTFTHKHTHSLAYDIHKLTLTHSGNG